MTTEICECGHEREKHVEDNCGEMCLVPKCPCKKFKAKERAFIDIEGITYPKPQNHSLSSPSSDRETSDADKPEGARKPSGTSVNEGYTNVCKDCGLRYIEHGECHYYDSRALTNPCKKFKGSHNMKEKKK